MAKIMLVEDDNNLREIYGARLLAEGHEIVAAKDGEEALALAVKEKPDLIISDVMMPRISGFDMLDILRNAPETKNTKVIMMTALSQAEDKARADKLGADRYLVKSQVTLEDVAKAVKDVLEDKPATDTPMAGATGVSANEPTNPPASEATGTLPETPATPLQSTTPQPSVIQPMANEPSTTPVVTDATTQPPVASPVSPMPDPSIPAPTVPDVAQVTSQPSPTPIVGATSSSQDNSVPTTTPVALDPPVGVGQDTSSSTTAIDNPVVTPTDPPESTLPQPDVVSAEATSSTDAPQQADPAPINVVLPPEASSEASASPQTTGAVIDGVQESAGAVGPNLSEALQQEATETAKTENSGTDESLNTEPQTPSIINGAENVGVITPTVPQGESSPSVDESKTEPEPEVAANPLDDTPKKRVIAPINDLTKKPDLAALAAAEEGVGNVVDPTNPQSQVVEPDNPTTPTAPTEDHNKIAL